MSDAADLLVEIGTEELPPKALRALMEAFAANMGAGLDEARLGHGAVRPYASPRRLAVVVESLAMAQEDRRVTQKGPPVSVAFDADGNMTAAGLAFAGKCGVEPGALGRTSTGKGEWLSCDTVEQGKAAAELLPPLIEAALNALPIPRRMRWGSSDAEFVRPVHWVVLLHGSLPIAATIMGAPAGRESRGHRFHAPGALPIDSPAAYAETLETRGRVIADYERRRRLIVEAAGAAARDAGGTVLGDDALYDEVTALVEWPVALTGSFEEAFLRLPREVVISTLTGHQRYFPIAAAGGELLPRFVTIANIESRDPQQVREGNERVIRPRLADAAFFWDNDRRVTLAARRDSLREVVYQHGLGSLYEKSARVAAICDWISATLDIDGTAARRAAELCKCDLLTGLVGEFPDLQGTMGRYYALADGEPEAVAAAIGEHYQPRFAGDDLPVSSAGQVLAIADRLDTLAGVFVLGRKPSGNRDPFGLRRAALGIVRLLVECRFDLDLEALIGVAVEAQPDSKLGKDEVAEDVHTFISERLRHYFLEREPSLAAETFDAVMVRRPASLVDFDSRLRAVQAFVALEPATSLAAANKRIANILKQADAVDTKEVSRKRLADPAEIELWEALTAARERVAPSLAARDYTVVLTELASLRPVVDRFFDEVMVMVDDPAVRANRLRLLRELRALFLDVADISRLGAIEVHPQAGEPGVDPDDAAVKQPG
jgi:glycyl-tRNA synthetase beta chain